MARGRYALGQYRDPVTLETAAGAEVAQLFARVDALSGYERIQAAQLQSAVECRVSLPAPSVAIDATMRFVWQTATRGAVTLNILAVIVGTDEIVCDCVEAHL